VSVHYTHGTHLVSSREPRGDPAENPAEHPEGTWRPPGPQVPSVRHRPLLRQPCPASKTIRTQRFAIRLRPDPPERASICTYSRTSQGNSYVHGTDVNTCTEDSCYAEVGFNTIMYYILG